jgi:hypothetical protein
MPFLPPRQSDLTDYDDGRIAEDMIDMSSKISGSNTRYPIGSSAGSFNILRDLVAQEKMQEQYAMDMLQRRLGITPSPLEDRPGKQSKPNNAGVFGKIFYHPDDAARYRNEVRSPQ